MQETLISDRRIYLKVWDPIVRIGHWLIVLGFAALYFPSDKFPLHAFAGYLIMGYMTFRIVWGFVGPRAVRFKTFLVGPSKTIRYGIDSMLGAARHTISHNPLGAWMVVWLILSMLTTGILGLMLYSAGQELGPLGNQVPAEWEGEFFSATILGHSLSLGLKDLHHWTGNIAASLVTLHLVGNLWTTALHRSNPVIGMITGVKDADQDDPESRFYPEVAPPRFARALNLSVGPAIGETIVVIVILTCLVWPLVELFVWLNQFLPAF